MGGSGGGGYFFQDAPERLAADVRQQEAKTRHQQFDAEVSNELVKLLGEYNERDAEGIQQHLDAIGQALEKEIDGHIDLLLGGSLAKRTFVNGLSDVDSLVVLNASELAKKSPKEVLDYFRERLKERFPNSKIEPDGFALQVTFTDAQIDLVPAIRTGKDTVRIPNERMTGWVTVNPKRFAEALTKVNQAQGQKVMPVIKLVKGMNAGLRQGHQLSGYHLEAIAATIFKDYTGPKNPKAMLTHFFEHAPARIRQRTQDITGQSTHADSYLGELGSAVREEAAAAFDRIGRRLKNADGAQSVDQWTKIVGA